VDPHVARTRLVTRLALQLYRELVREGAFYPDAEHRRILEAASILQEVGWNRNERSPGKLTYRIIRKLRPPLGWSEQQMHCVALVARYHRGALPKNGYSHLVGLNAKRRNELLRLAGVLRLANAFDLLDSRRILQVRLERRDGILVLHGFGVPLLSTSGEKLARARYLLEAACKLPLLLPSSPAEAKSKMAAPLQKDRRV
jgi:exopolyphosphatase/guanosine-5'-triphosphate,3'-diphosphate pyrophosphatase